MRSAAGLATVAVLILLACVPGRARDWTGGPHSAGATPASVAPSTKPGSPGRGVCPVCLHLEVRTSLSPTQLEVFKDGLQRIWMPYDVELVFASPGSDRGQPGLCLHIVIDDAPVAGAPGPPTRTSLGAAVFLESGLPRDVLYGSVPGTWQVLREARYSGRVVAGLPRALQEQILARALACVIAHELGHILLGSAHARTGLMRAVWPTDELAGGFQPFRLDPRERDQLKQVGHCRAVLASR